MNNTRIILHHNLDKSFTVSIRREDSYDFHLKVFNPFYENHKIYKLAYDYAYALSGFLKIDFVEIKQ